jgi:tetratricopeptide (TPR) repeat protein
VSNNPSLTRNDLIIETMFGIKKKINNFVSLNARYYFLKDYSNEPFRKINANTVILALEMSLQKKPSYIFKASDYAHLSDSTIYPTVEELRPEDLANIGYEFILKGQYDDAIKYNLKALSKDSTITEAHINLGIAYYKKGRLADAIREWKTALKLDPSNLKVRKLVEKAQAEEKVKNK